MSGRLIALPVLLAFRFAMLFPIGGVFRGEVGAGVRVIPESGFQVRLTNLQRIMCGSGKHRSVREVVLWDEEQVVDYRGVFELPVFATGEAEPERFASPLSAPSFSSPPPISFCAARRSA